VKSESCLLDQSNVLHLEWLFLINFSLCHDRYVDRRWLDPAQGANGKTALMTERLYDHVSKNDLQMAFLALAHGAKVDALLESGLSVFHQLVIDGLMDVYSLQLVILHCGDLARKNATGFDALHLAAHHNHAHYCKLLLSQGFDQSTRTNGGRTAKELAADNKATAVLTLFETGQLPQAATDGHVDEWRKRVTESISRLLTHLADRRVALGDTQDQERVFDIAKQIRMVKISLNTMEKDGLLKK
jgi:hypothetical protein